MFDEDYRAQLVKLNFIFETMFLKIFKRMGFYRLGGGTERWILCFCVCFHATYKRS